MPPAAQSEVHRPATLAALLRQQAQRLGDAPALLAQGREALSYAALNAQTQQVADHLQALGATASTRVAVLLPNGPEMAVAFLGVSACAACAPLNPAYHAAELRFHLQDTRADMLLLQRGGVGPAHGVARELDLPVIEIDVDDAAPAGAFRVVGDAMPPGTNATATASTPDHLALLLHTSGTTARPKLVPLSQANLMASAHQIAAHLALSPADRCLNVMPLFHIHGLVGALLATLAGGGSMVCLPGFDGDPFFDAVARFGPSWTTAVPTVLQALLAHGAAYRQKAPNHRFRFVRSSSAALPAATLRQLQALLQAPVVEAYGMTEASHQMASNPVAPGAQTPGSVGVAAGVQIAILDEAGRPRGSGQPGEVAVRGPGVMRGYENHPQANAEAFHDGWFRTGDLGQQDAQGRLFISGRLKEIVNRGGEKVSPREVDDALLEHPAVAQAAAFGVPHPSLGEDLAAAVVLRVGAVASEAALREHLFARLAGFKVPSQIVQLHAIPAGATGKVQRGGLHRLLGATLARAFEAPADANEVAVAALFGQVLQSEAEAVGRHDNFFALGGDSLRGARLLAQVNRRFGVNLPVTSLFRHPSVAELAALLPPPGSAMSEVAAAQVRQLGSLRPRPPGALVPCSFSQEALWIVERLLGDSGAYNTAQAVRIEGALDEQALERALQALVQRHEVLRTGLEEADGVPVQRVHPQAVASLSRMSSRLPAAADPEAALLQHLGELARRPFDLATPPLLRASLWPLADRAGRPCQVLLLVVHHTVADGWAMAVIARELGALYAAFRHGRVAESGGATPGLPPLALQFADWAVWQRGPVAAEGHAADLRYWRQKLAGLVPLEFPADRQRPPQLSHAGRAQRFNVPAELLARLRAVAREGDATLFMLLLAAFKLLLLRWTGQDDVAVGSPVAARDRPELEALVGDFVNTVVLRSDLSGNPRFTELLARVRETALEAYPHQQLPFEQLVAALSPQRSMGRNPLFQVSFALNNQPAPQFALEGLQLTPLTLPTTVAKFDLSLSFVEQQGGLSGVFEYSTELFDAGTVERLCAQVLVLLGGIAADPTRRLAALPLLGEAERSLIVDTWNRTAQRHADDAAVHTQVEAQAERRPEAVAVVFGSERLTYRQLNTRANRLAHRLRGLGVGPEVLVGVCLERSVELVVAVLAVMKAGGAHVPLDPDLPPARLAFQLQDTAAPVLLTQSRLLPLLPEADPVRPRHTLCLDGVDESGDDSFAHEAEHNPVCLSAPDHLAYVIYTSGSTGQPKGVQVPHRGLANLMGFMQSLLRLTPEDRLLQKTPIGFDASVWEFFAPLQAGATLVVARPGEHRHTDELARTLRDQGITVLQMVPSALDVLAEEPGFGERSRLRHLLVGGEALTPALVNKLRARLPTVTLGNLYGPTEASCNSHHAELPPHGPGDRPIPIGRPIANTQCFILDAQGQPVPIGVAGELYIGGAGLARGYLNQPALTAEQFAEHAFLPGQRLYRTGDRARYRADGQVLFLGRTDFQVKVRGHRIELGEIEAVLRAQPGVSNGVVLAREDVPGLTRLVAYVVARGAADADASTAAAAIDPHALRRALAAQLPEVMVPADIVVLPRLPSLPNGKLDRRALPAPALPAEPARRTAPRTPAEHLLWQIWREVLHTEHVGVHDHFFELGGHSLLAMQVVVRLRARQPLELPLRAVFEHPTLEALAAEIERRLAGGAARDAAGGAAGLSAQGDGPPGSAVSTALASQPLAPIPKVAREGALAVSYSQRRMWLVQTLNPQTLAYNMTFGLRLLGPLAADALVQAIATVVLRHEAFRTRFGSAHGEVQQWVDPPRPAQIERHDLRAVPVDQREAAARTHRDQMAGGRFDLSCAGLYRIRLLQMADADHVLLWVNHHVIGDHWSDGILLREMGQAYAALRQGREPALPPLRIEYADYAAWQRAPEQRLLLAPQMAYWKRRLRGLRPLPLPHDRTTRELPSGRGSSVSARLPPATVVALKRLGRSHGVTPFMAMLACFKLVLSRHCGQTDIAVGSPVANRTRVESEHLVGALVNTLVMRTDLSGDPTWAALLARVKDTALEAFAHQDAPFERLVEEIEFERSTSRQPLVQVLFNLVNAPYDVTALPGLRLQPFDYTSIAAQFELGLNVDDAFGDVRLAYSTDLFERPTAQRLLASFLCTVDSLLADPSASVRDAQTLGPDERADLQRWNATEVPFETGLRLGDLVRRRALAHGGGTAVVFEGRWMSLAELDAAACALALRLRAAGAGPGARVGVCLERGIELVTALLGVVYSGAAYVPLDPSYPAERLAGMCEDAGLVLVVSREHTWSRLRPELPPHLTLVDIDIGIDKKAGGPAAPAQVDFQLLGTADDPAYVIYTSGSTGRPKGVVVPHRAVVNFLASMAREPGLASTDVLMAVTTLSFDIAVLELLLPLCVGAQVVLAGRDDVLDGRALRALLETSRATVMQATPSTWRLLLEAGWEGGPGFKALVGGESLPPDLAQQLLARAELWNLYGPTETTVWSTCWKVSAPEQGIRIGRPIANTQVHVLDERRRPCPIGVAGEIYIGGEGVVTGYLEKPDLTEQHFVADPFSPAPGARMYRTGDRGRWCHDGLLEHLGRLDFQVKLRGHRIELGEIEARLATHPGVARCVVVVRDEPPGDPRLVAYVVPRGAPPEAAVLRSHLRAHLPEFMLPQQVVMLDAIPLLPNGKTDRRALPAPALASPDPSRTAHDAPRTDAEKRLASLWQELLGEQPIGRSDNFFDLGGHSLLAMRAVFEWERRAGVHLDLRRLVHESLAQLALPGPARPGPRDGEAPNRAGLVDRILGNIGIVRSRRT